MFGSCSLKYLNSYWIECFLRCFFYLIRIWFKIIFSIIWSKFEVIFSVVQGWFSACGMLLCSRGVSILQLLRKNNCTLGFWSISVCFNCNFTDFYCSFYLDFCSCYFFLILLETPPLSFSKKKRHGHFSTHWIFAYDFRRCFLQLFEFSLWF